MPRLDRHKALHLGRYGAVLLFMLLIGARAEDAQAQNEVYRPSQTQIGLIEKGAEATRAGDYDRALQHYQEAVDQGPFNLAQLGLGRALQKNGDCQGALKQFKAARDAPAVRAPSRTQIQERLDQFIAELKNTCPGILVVTCPQPNLNVTLDNNVITCGESIELSPGKYMLRGVLNAQEKRQEVRIVALERANIELRIKPTAVPPQENGAALSAVLGKGAAQQLIASARATAARPALGLKEESFFNRDVVGWGLVGLGGVMLATGAVFTGFVLDNNDEGQTLAQQNIIDGDRGREVLDQGTTYTTVQNVSYGIGAALLLAGIATFVFADDAPKNARVDDPSRPYDPSVHILQTPDGWSATLSGQF